MTSLTEQPAPPDAMTLADPPARPAAWHRVAAATGGGAITAVSLPPWGWWPLAFVGLAVLIWSLEGQPWRRRVALGTAWGAGMFVPGLWWMGEFTAVGAPLAVAIEVAFVVGAAAAAPSGRGRWLGVPAALVLAEAARGAAPFGGVPMAGVALGQVAGPIGQAARVGGALLVLGAAAAAAAALAAVVARRWVVAAGSVVVVAVVAIAGIVAPDGGTGPARRLAIVQGGGVRGMRAVNSDPRTVFEAHLAASAEVRAPVDLVLWPEDVIDVDGPIVAAPERDEVAAVARATGATLVGGVVEDAGPERFFNAVVAWGPNGDIVGRYDKVHRVPFGEYVPGRDLIRRVADLTVIPRDAIPGRGTGLLRTPAGPFGVVISYEVFFADRARSAIRAGGELLLVPTNASSFRTSQVPTTEVATARLRAIETGRDVVQSAPTGYGGFIDNRGELRVRTTLGRQQVIERTVHLRTGRTLYMRFGDLPILVLAAAGLAAAWLVERAVPRRRSRRPRRPGARPAGS